MEYDNTNTGALFKAEKKSENHPDYTGKINIGGTDHYLSAWIKESKAGYKFMSLSLGKAVDSNLQRSQQQEQQKPQESKRLTDFYNDDIPF